jgi:hypothetical protein
MKKKALLKELVRLAQKNVVGTNEFTVPEYVEELRNSGIEITECAARSKLTRMVNIGELNRRKAVLDGNRISIYSYPQNVKRTLSNPRLDE